MGIRINKIMCYFAENLEFDQNILCDFIDNADANTLYEMAKKDNYWETQKKKLSWSSIGQVLVKASEPPYRINQNIIFDNEFLPEDGVGFIPFGSQEAWQRYDDDIDYQEFYADNPDASTEPRIKYMDRSLYPYEGYINRYTGERIERRNEIIQMYKYAETIEDKLDWLKNNTGGLSIDVFKYNTIPLIPDDIRMIMHYSKAFRNVDESFLKLRPAIVQYWS